MSHAAGGLVRGCEGCQCWYPRQLGRATEAVSGGDGSGGGGGMGRGVAGWLVHLFLGDGVGRLDRDPLWPVPRPLARKDEVVGVDGVGYRGSELRHPVLLQVVPGIIRQHRIARNQSRHQSAPNITRIIRTSPQVPASTCPAHAPPFSWCRSAGLIYDHHTRRRHTHHVYTNVNIAALDSALPLRSRMPKCAGSRMTP